MDAKHDYLVAELWILAWDASVQHADLYKEGSELSSRRLFRKKLIDYLSSDVIPSYHGDEIREEQHYKNIDGLVAYANGVGETVLGEHGYKYGVAQKLLNLVLKYRWCLGAISEPPHCPVDSIIIAKTSYRDMRWTKIVQKSDYQMIIEDIKRLAGTQTIAMWEISNFSRR